MNDLDVQTVSLMGSLLILSAFVGGQFRKLKPADLPYVVCGEPDVIVRVHIQ